MDAMGMDGLQWGMFVGGAVMAAVPVTLGIGIYVLRQYLRTRREEEEISRTGRGSP
jgi:hypothetical protein